MQKREKVLLCLLLVLAAVTAWDILAHHTSFAAMTVGSITSRIEFRDYTVKKYSFTVQLPKSTSITEEYISGEEVLFSAYLQDRKLSYWGYIQFWHIPNLEEFLQSSKAHSRLHFRSYRSQPVRFKFYRGYKISWTAVFADGRTVMGREYFLQKNDGKHVVRISLFTDRRNLEKQLEHLGTSIVSSIKW